MGLRPLIATTAQALTEHCRPPPPVFTVVGERAGPPLRTDRLPHLLCRLAGEGFPSIDRHLRRTAVRSPSRSSGGRVARRRSASVPEPAERLVDVRHGVVLDRPPHALDRLLRPVPVSRIVPRGNRPQRGLRAVIRPMRGGAVAHRIQTGFVLPVVVAAREGQAILGPNDLRPRDRIPSSRARPERRRPSVRRARRTRRPRETAPRPPTNQRVSSFVTVPSFFVLRLTPASARQDGS